MTAPAETYAELVRRSKEVGVVNSCASVLGWDQQTYMPRKGALLRGEQMAFLAGLSHQKATDPKFGELLAAVEGSPLTSRNASPKIRLCNLSIFPRCTLFSHSLAGRRRTRSSLRSPWS